MCLDSVFMATKAASEIGESTNKIYSVIGGFLPFFGIKHKAVSTYIEAINKSNLSPELKMMAIMNTKKTYKELKNQSSIAEIAMESAKEGTDFSETSPIDDEWLNRFMDSAKFVSSEEGQMLWGHVLAGEFEKPGTFPLQVIRVLSEVSSRNAKVFSNICNLLVKIIHLDTDGKSIEDDDESLFLFEGMIEEYKESLNINFESLSELQILGLIQYEPLAGFIEKIELHKVPILHLSYAGNEATIVKYPDKRFQIGSVILTQTGQSIANLIERTKVDGHFEKVIKCLKENQVEFSEPL